MGFAGYPTLRLMTLAETGTRGLPGAALGSAADRDEATVARRLLPLLRPGMLILLDRAFDANAFLGEVAATGAMLLARAKSTRHPPVLGHLPDGSYLSHLDGLDVRIIEATLTVTGADGSRVRDSYRLITTLTDHRRFPAATVVRLYHERWEIESAYFALRHTLLGGHVLRSGDRPGLEQETWALLTLYQLLRMAMVTAIETRPGTDPDRASFTTAIQAAQDQLTAARGVCPDGPVDLPGAIGRAVLATLLPARRPRYSARKVKCATSRYLNRDDGRPAHPAAITAIDIAVCTPPVDLKPGRTRRDRRSTPRPPQPAHPPGADHRHHHRPAPARLERPRARHPPGRQAPEHAHPARRMGTARLLHPHRIRHLRPQHAASRYTVDNRARPLTSRPCAAQRRALISATPVQQAEAQIAAGLLWQDHGLIFASEVGTPMDPDNFSHSFTWLCRRAGLGHWHPHELRHSGASLRLAQGTPLHVVSEVLGHASIAITKDVYGHLLEGDKRAAAKSMSRALFGG